MEDFSSSILGAPAVIIAALISALILMRLFGAPADSHRFSSIDGLRGYLALAVFIHHASIWPSFAAEGQWKPPTSMLYGQLGEVGVAFFFMITAFLFTEKIANSRGRGVNWLTLYVSRVLRLTPLYLVAVALVLVVVLVLSKGVWSERPLASAPRLGAWLLFAIPGAWDLNHVKHTALIMAGVTWSLAYEWFFYLLLPVQALFMGLRQRWTVVFSALAIAVLMLVVWKPNALLLSMFSGGVIASWVRRSGKLDRFCDSRLASCAVIFGLILEFSLFSNTDGLLQVALLSGCFILIACGTDLFGVLRASVSRMLGELAYGLYLMHGLLLFTAFTFFLGRDVVAQLVPSLYWAIVALLTILLVPMCFILFVVIERPGMNAAPKISRWLLMRLFESPPRAFHKAQ